jgi:hypothetical protein
VASASSESGSMNPHRRGRARFAPRRHPRRISLARAA